MNSRPPNYELGALPLSYPGRLKHRLRIEYSSTAGLGFCRDRSRPTPDLPQICPAKADRGRSIGTLNKVAAEETIEPPRSLPSDHHPPKVQSQRSNRGHSAPSRGTFNGCPHYGIRRRYSRPTIGADSVIGQGRQ